MMTAMTAATVLAAAGLNGQDVQHSEIEVCNDRTAPAFVAVSGAIAGERFTEGWLQVAPDGCVSLGIVDGPGVHVFAVEDARLDAGRFDGWTSPSPAAESADARLCVTPGENFVYEGARTNCQRGEAAGYFQRLTIDSNHTVWRIR
ncbi:DUF1036 domain-containing protein [Alkalicaulis satelles]|nr:DUF1036 domain-containing protein [Alkalicaulis satelles]